jgi:BASS family bile acid:Na+ symporter
LHNGLGYLLGYFGARAVRLPESAARTVSIEVGLQNAGMATGLAISVLNSPEAGLAAAVFGPTMNITGSMLAAWWRKRPAK